MTGDANLQEIQTDKNFNLLNSFNDNNYESDIYSQTNHSCEYLSELEFHSKITNVKNNHFSLLSFNIQSINSKWQEFKTFLASTFDKNLPSLLLLQETWLKSDEGKSFILDEYKSYFVNRDDRGSIGGRESRGGGVGLFIRKDYQFEILDELSIFIPRVFESQFIKVKISRNKFYIVGNIYRPNTAPHADIQRSIMILEDILNKIKTNFKNAQDVILSGDLNLNLLNHKTHRETGQYLDILLENGLLPLITLPTRIANRSATLIDHISTNIKDDNYDTGIITSDISDHFPIFYIKHFQDIIEEKNSTIKRNINEYSMLAFKNLLENHNWSNILENDCPEMAFENFFQIIDNYFEKSFPELVSKAQKKRIKHNPWMSNSILISRKKKERLFRIKLKKPSQENRLKFKEFNQIYTKTVRAARKKYYEEKFEMFSKDCRKTWENINDILGRKKGKMDIPKVFNSNGNILSGNFEIAEGFNDFFSNIGPKLAKSIPKSNKLFTDYLDNPTTENFVFANMRPDIINEALSKLKNKNSSGPDKISTNLLKYIAPSIMRPICHLFDLSFKTGYIPTNLKTAKVVPVFKSGEAESFNNYRPISLLSSFSKLLEKVAAKQMIQFLNKYNLLYEHQYGFRPKHNTTHPVLHFLDKIYNSWNKKEPEYSLGIFIDLTKAFDTCDVSILIQKLYHYGFREESNFWFFNYLNGRKQYVSINGISSKYTEMTCGVPQGSILGPLLFLILINDLPKASSFFTLLFADDTTLQLSSENLKQLYKKANIELAKISDWFKANKLTLNAKKTKYICFKPNSKKEILIYPDLSIENSLIDRIGSNCKDEYFKFVGIRIDEHLSWKFHVEHVSNKASSATFALSRVKSLLPSNIKLMIYNSLFKSYIEFGISAWGINKESNMKRILLSQKRAVRYIHNAKNLAHCDPLFHKYNILKIKDLCDLSQAIFMFKLTHNLLPSSFGNFIPKLQNFDRTMNFKVEICFNNNLKHLPSHSLPKLWNGLPLTMKRYATCKQFKSIYLDQKLSSYNTICTNHKCKSCYA